MTTPAALFEAAQAREREGRPRAAEMLHRRLLALLPAVPATLGNLARLAAARGDRTAAGRLYRQALRLAPDLAEALANLGQLHHAGGDRDAAAAAARNALARKPHLTEAWISLGHALQERGEPDAAAAAYRRTLCLDPSHAVARWRLGLADIQAGRGAEGWAGYEARWRIDRARPFSQPAWDGRSLPAGRLLVWGEQGIGDEIMFAALLPELRRRRISWILECDPRLVPLFARSFPEGEAVARADPPDARLSGPDIAAQVPSGSPLHRLGLAAPPTDTSGYLRPDPARVARLRARHAGAGVRRLIGLSWRTASTAGGAERSLALHRLAPALAGDGVGLLSLQYGETADDRHAAALAGAAVGVDPGIDAWHDLDGLAALAAATDCVVSVDNATLHLAAALSVPALGLLPHAAEWRWMVSGAAPSPGRGCPWYPGLRLLRQSSPGDWDGVLAVLREQIQAWDQA